jgi:AmmeMemoRadiSam system protein A
MTTSDGARRSADAKRILLRLARAAVASRLAGAPSPAWDRDDPGLAALGAAFVTFRRRATGELRGCRGEVEARRPVAESVLEGAIAGALQDPRFAPVESAELPTLSIEISVLTPMVPATPEDVEPGRHGVLIRDRGRGGLFLPQVATEQGWNREQLLRGVCQKAGLPPDTWRHSRDATLFVFEADVWGEDEGDAGNAP